jgi:sugar transferase EpsL
MTLLFPPGIPLSKRLFDLAFTIPGFILISPLLGVVALVIIILERRPILFRQERPGYQGRVFTLYKFRTMRKAFNKKGQMLPDSQRLMPIGRFLRATSLDELPELINILRGEMSLVGPRPLLVEYLNRYTPQQMRRHNVLPGITGWAQINGRNALSWEEKFRLDVWYVDHWSFWLDIRILVSTFWKVIQCEGISQPGQDTVEKFQGPPDKV